MSRFFHIGQCWIAKTDSAKRILPLSTWMPWFEKPTLSGTEKRRSALSPGAAADCLTTLAFHVRTNSFISFSIIGKKTNSKTSWWIVLYVVYLSNCRPENSSVSKIKLAAAWFSRTVFCFPQNTRPRIFQNIENAKHAAACFVYRI